MCLHDLLRVMMTQVGYKPKPEGICYPLARVFMDVFFENGGGVVSFNNLLQLVKENGSASSGEVATLMPLQLRSFLQSIEKYAVVNLRVPDDSLRINHPISGCYIDSELQYYCECLLKAAEKIGHSFLLFISNGGHCVTIARDQKGQWSLMDANQLPVQTYDSLAPEKLREFIQKSFSHMCITKYSLLPKLGLILTTQLYVGNNLPEVELNSFISDLSCSKDWTRIHKVDSWKARAIACRTIEPPVIITWLLAAATVGDVSTIKGLLNFKNCVFEPDHENRLPLDLAIMYDHLKLVEYFLLHSDHADLKRCGCGSSPLYLAVYLGRIEMTKAMLSRFNQVATATPLCMWSELYSTAQKPAVRSALAEVAGNNKIVADAIAKIDAAGSESGAEPEEGSGAKRPRAA